MATNAAPDHRSRGRERVLTYLFGTALMIAVMFVTPAAAAAASKASAGDGNGKASASTAASTKANASANSSAKAEAKPAAKAASAKSSPANSAPKKARPEQARGKAGGIEKRSRERGRGGLGAGAPKAKAANGTVVTKPPSEKNSGPCTRHAHRDGFGHDNHRGYGWGHYGKTGPPSEPPTDPDPDDDDDGEPPAEPPGEEPPSDPGDGVTPRTPEDFLPFTPPALPVAFRPKAADNAQERFLPYTGSRSSVLWMVAALAAVLGGVLRSIGNARQHAYRRIAR